MLTPNQPSRILALMLSLWINQVLAADDFAMNTIDWQSKGETITRVIIRNQFGDLRLIQSNSNQVKIRAVAQTFGALKNSAAVETNLKDGTLTIRLLLDQQERLEEAGKNRIDTSVFLPPGVPASVYHENGRLMTKRVDNDLTIKSVDAKLDIKTTGQLNAYTQRGQVKVKLNDDLSDGSVIQTSTGTIEVYYDWSNPRFKVHTHGALTTNDPALLGSQQGEQPTYTLGNQSSGSVVTLKSDSGNIHLIKAVQKEEKD